MRTAPTEPGGHGLLEGRTVVITAAAGSGIGSAVARRCLLEGARIVISDAHERRLGETADALGEELGSRPAAIQSSQETSRGSSTVSTPRCSM